MLSSPHPVVSQTPSITASVCYADTFPSRGRLGKAKEGCVRAV